MDSATGLPASSGSRAWLLLAASLLVCLPPILVRIGEPEPDRIMENITILSSQETWVRQHAGEKDAWLMPSWNGRPRIEKPPMSVWLNMLAWADLDPDTAPADTVVLRARLLGAGFAVLALVSTFWAGMSLTRDPRMAALAMLVTGTSAAFIRQARFATYDTHMLGFVTLAVAAGLWAMRPAKPEAPAGWSAAGWLIAGLAMAGGVLTKGPLAYFLVLGPLAVMALVVPHHRGRNLAGLGLALLVGLLAAAPWALYMTRSVGQVRERLAVEYFVPADVVKPPWYYLIIVGMVFPWSLWLVVSLFLPFLKENRTQRRQLLVAWFWFLFIFVFFSATWAKVQRYLSPIFPSAGLIVAQLWAHYGRLAEEGNQPRRINWLRVPHWAVLLILSIAVPVFVGLQPRLVEAGRLEQIELPGFGTTAAVWLGIVLVALAGLGALWHFENRPWRAAVVTAVWMSVLSTAGYSSYAQSYHSRYAQRADAERVAAAAAGRRLVYLELEPKVDVEPTKVFLFYARRIIPPVAPDELAGLVKQGEPVSVIIRAGAGREEVVERLGLRRQLEYADDFRKGRVLYTNQRSDARPPKLQRRRVRDQRSAE
ncbi:MAG: phospholipid carrier-dependent glycosyltransferase [Verrucomicrobiota bacterium]